MEQKEQQEWLLMQKDPTYITDPLCCEAEIPGGNLIYETCKIKKNDNVNDMTYEQLITWKNYTDEQILDMEYGPKDAWANNSTYNCKWTKLNALKCDFNRKKSHEIHLKQVAERKWLESEKKRKDKFILEKQREEQFKKNNILAEKKKLKEEKRRIKILRDKEILEYVDNYIPETNLEKIAYAQYIQNKHLMDMINGQNSQLDYLASRV